MSAITAESLHLQAPSQENDPFSGVATSVRSEIAQLQAQGYDVALTDTPDEHRPTPARQAQIDDEVAQLEEAPLPIDGAAQFRTRPGIASWAPLTKRAIALHSLYNPESKTVGQGIDPAVYDAPLFDGLSANQIVRAKQAANGTPQKAETIIASYANFIPAAIDAGTSSISTRDFFQGVKDAEAVRTRATAATELVSAHIATNPLLAGRQDLISASLACGAAGPVYKMVENLQAQGHGFSQIVLLDQDPMALATAHSLAEHYNVQAKVQLQLRDLFSSELTEFIEPHSVDVVDLLGLFEYVPNHPNAPWAAGLLSKVKEIMRPGGYIVFGNMLNERPQQTFFSNVVGWPKLQQRSLGQVIDVVAAAGFDPQSLQTRVPSEGVYAVYGIQVPHVVEQQPARPATVASMVGQQALAEY